MYYGKQVEIPARYDVVNDRMIPSALSTREYVEYAAAAELPGETKYDQPRPVRIVHYLDIETGIVTADVRAFEKWIGA